MIQTLRSSTATLRMITLGIAAVLVATAAVSLARPTAGAKEAGPSSLHVEVAEVGSRFRSDDQHVDADDLPTRGNHFVAEGYIYPAGTLSCDDVACNGVNYDADGNPSPEFPDEVIGMWTCWGVHLEDAAAQSTAPLSATTQVFDLGAQPGETTIVTTGLEIPSLGVPSARAITGGTGEYATAAGTQTQTLRGFNSIDLFHEGQPWFGITLDVELDIRGEG